MNLKRWYSLALCLFAATAFADSNAISTFPNHGKSFKTLPFRTNGVNSLGGTHAHSGGDAVLSLKQAANTLQVQGNARSAFVYDGTTTATTCQSGYTVVYATGACYALWIPGHSGGGSWSYDCAKHMDVVNCSGTANGPWLITLYTPTGFSYVTWNEGGDTLSGNDYDGNSYSNNVNKIEVSQLVLRGFLQALGVNSSVNTCLSGSATGTALNKVLYTSRNALCEDEISALGSGYGTRTGQCVDYQATDGYYINPVWKIDAAGVLPAASDYSDATMITIGGADGGISDFLIGGLGGIDAVRGKKSDNSVTGLFIRSDVQTSGHSVRLHEYKTTNATYGGSFGSGPFDSFRKPTFAYDSARKVWFAFGHMRGTNTTNVTYWTSTDRTNWTYRGLVRNAVSTAPCDDTCMASCTDIKSWQIPIRTRHPVSAAYSLSNDSIVVAYVNYEQDQKPPNTQYTAGPSGGLSYAVMSAASDLSEKKWMGIASETWVGGNGVTSGQVTVGCSIGDIGAADEGGCTAVIQSPLAARDLLSSDMQWTDIIKGSGGSACVWRTGVPIGLAMQMAYGVSFYPAALVRSNSGTTDKQAVAVVGTDGALYVSNRTGGGYWDWFAWVSLDIAGSSNDLREFQFPVFTNTGSGESGYELLFTAKDQDADIECYTPD